MPTPSRSNPRLASRAKPARARAATTSTADRILDAAEERFAAHGYGGTSLGDIADDVRIRTPSLYKHFGSKRDLYVAVLRRLLDPYFSLLGELLAVPLDGADAERNLVAVLTHYLETPNLARLVQQASLARGAELELLVKRWYGPLFARATDLTKSVPYLRGRARKSHAISLVVAFHSMMSGYVTMAPLHAELTGEDPLGQKSIARFLELMRSLALGLWTT